MAKVIPTIIGAVVMILVVVSVLLPVTSSHSADGEDTLEVIILGGQSNAAYTVGTPRIDPAVTNEEIPQPVSNCYYYGTDSAVVYHSTNLATCAIHSMTSEGQWIIGGEEASIAYMVSKATNADVLIINTAVPAQKVSAFIPGGTYYQRTVDIMTAALDLIPEKYHQVRCGWVWIQGEADKATTISDYVADFHKVQDFYASYGFDTCYLVETDHGHSGNATEAHHYLVAHDPKVILGSAAPSTFSVAQGTLVEGNEIHYSQKGRDVVGLQVGEAMTPSLTYLARSSPVYPMVSLIPILVLAGLAIGVVGSFISNRD